MTEHLLPEAWTADDQHAERVKHLKQASRVIITTREKMPHSAQWQLALRRTLWRYTQEVLLHKGSHQSKIKTTEKKSNDA
jgi:hypothetical protein